MSKTVTEVEFKFFLKYVDALTDTNYFIEAVEVEGGEPPSTWDSKTVTGNFRLKKFLHEGNKVKSLVPVYLKNY